MRKIRLNFSNIIKLFMRKDSIVISKSSPLYLYIKSEYHDEQDYEEDYRILVENRLEKYDEKRKVR